MPLSPLRAVLVAVLLLPGMTSAQGMPSDSGRWTVEVRPDIVYSTHAGRDFRLDLYLPQGSAPDGWPAVVVIRGGSWRAGDKEGFGTVAAALAERGFAAASIEYRTSAEAPFPAALHDARAAVRWLRANAGAHGIDADRIGVLGGSAGGQLAALLGVTGDGQVIGGEPPGVASSSGHSAAVQAVVVLAGVLDLTRSTEMSEALTGAVEEFLGVGFDEAPQQWTLASPVTYVSESASPVLLVHSQHDPVVDARQTFHLAERYLQAGVAVEIVLIPEAPHSLWNEEWLERTIDAAFPFLSRHLAGP